jgi:hypothetical protein
VRSTRNHLKFGHFDSYYTQRCHLTVKRNVRLGFGGGMNDSAAPNHMWGGGNQPILFTLNITIQGIQVCSIDVYIIK